MDGRVVLVLVVIEGKSGQRLVTKSFAHGVLALELYGPGQRASKGAREYLMFSGHLLVRSTHFEIIKQWEYYYNNNNSCYIYSPIILFTETHSSNG